MFNLLRIKKTHKLSGEILTDAACVELYDFIKTGTIFHCDGVDLVVENSRIAHKGLIVKFTGLSSIDDVIKFRGKICTVDCKVFPKDHVINQLNTLSNAEVLSNNKHYGYISDVFFVNGNPFVEIDTENGDEVVQFHKNYIKITDENKKIVELLV